MKQFRKILRFELENFLHSKAFVGVTLFLVAAIVIVMFFPNLKAAFRSEDNEKTEELPVMLVYAQDDALASLVQPYFRAAFTDYDVRIAEGTMDNVKSQIVDGTVECAFEMESASAYTYYVNNLSMYDANAAIADSALQEIVRASAMIESGMTPEQVAQLMQTQTTGETVTLGKNQTENFFYTYLMIFSLYMCILLYGQMIATNVATEKSSRAMELLITSAKPTSMMFGKVLASCIAGMAQLIVVFGTAVVTYRINGAAWNNEIIDYIFNIPVGLLAYMIVFFVLGFLIYAFLYGAIGSTVSKLEDVNTSVTPLTFLFLMGFIVTITSMSSGEVDTVLMKVCSYIPFTSPMAMFTRLCMSTVAWYEIATSVVILVASVVGIGFVSARIYRVGVLLYGTKPKLGTLIKATRKA